MEKLAQTRAFENKQNIVLEGFDPISAGGFTQVPNVLLNDPKLTFPAKVVYAKLLSYAWHNNLVYPGEATMARDLGTSQSTISRALGELEGDGWLDIIRLGQGWTNRYVLHHTVTPKY